MFWYNITNNQKLCFAQSPEALCGSRSSVVSVHCAVGCLTVKTFTLCFFRYRYFTSLSSLILSLVSAVTVTSPLCPHPSGVTPAASCRPQIPAGRQEELHALRWGQTPESWFTEEAAGVCCGSLVSVRMLHVSCWLTRSHLHRIGVSPGLCVSVVEIMWPWRLSLFDNMQKLKRGAVEKGSWATFESEVLNQLWKTTLTCWQHTLSDQYMSALCLQAIFDFFFLFGITLWLFELISQLFGRATTFFLLCITLFLRW